MSRRDERHKRRQAHNRLAGGAVGGLLGSGVPWIPPAMGKVRGLPTSQLILGATLGGAALGAGLGHVLTKKAHAVYLGELAEIAQQRDLTCFMALDKLAEAQTSAGYVNAPGSMNMGGRGAPSPGAAAAGGITNMPGMSMHCDKCFCELKEVTPRCPKCGAKLKQRLDLKGAQKGIKTPETNEPQQPDRKKLENIESGATGAEAAEAEELSEGSYLDTGKYAGVKSLLFGKPKKSMIQRLPKGLQNPAAGGVILTSLYVGNEGRKALAEAAKTAGVRVGANPVWTIRRAKKMSKLFPQKSKKNTTKGLARVPSLK